MYTYSQHNTNIFSDQITIKSQRVILPLEMPVKAQLKQQKI